MLRTEAVDPATLLVTLAGEFDLSGALSLKRSIHAARGRRRVVIDLSGVSWLDSSALAVIVETHEAVHGRGGTFGLVAPPARIWEMFELTGLDHIPTYATVEEALAAPARL